MQRQSTILIVDDEPNAIRVLSAILRMEGYTVLQALDAARAFSIIENQPVDAVITDIKMPNQDGYHLFDRISERFPHIPTIFLTAYGTVERAVQAISQGAFHYFVKPPDYAKLKQVLAKAVERSRQDTAIAVALNNCSSVDAPRVITCSPPIARILSKIEMLKDSETSVLITGETGTGKEVIANQIHHDSLRKDKPFIAVNCGAIPKDLVESELFGYEKGAFTGAQTSRPGKFEEAAGGTVFLDEIGEMDLTLQVKLLRVLQERSLYRLGSNRKINVDFRLITSTNKDLHKAVMAGTFRKDLFYRINVISIHVPPLADRREDIPLLAATFLKEFCAREGKQLSLSSDVRQILNEYPWPGNIRQLRNVIEHAVIMSPGPRISVRDLPEELRQRRSPHCDQSSVYQLRALEIQAARDAVARCNGNKSMAARQLGISRKSLYAKLSAANSL